MGLFSVGSRPRTAPPQHYEVEDIAPCELVEVLLSTYPELAVRPGLLRLVVHILRSPDQVHGAVFLPASFLAEILGRQEAAARKKAVTRLAISDLRAALSARATGIPGALHIQPAQHGRHLATGFKLEVPEHVRRLADESVGFPDEGPVTINGWCRVFPDATRTELSDTSTLRQEMADMVDDQGGSELSRTLQSYLNGHDPRVFQALRRAVCSDEAADWVRSTVPAGPKRGAIARTFRSILAQPVPIYATSTRTARISAVGRNVTSLPSAVRQWLTGRVGWMELDLTQAQLACNAKAWDVPLVLEALGDPGYRLWDDLIRGLGVDAAVLEADPELYRKVKRALKQPVYGVSFGMSHHNLKNLGLLKYDKKRDRWVKGNDWATVSGALGELGVTVPEAAAVVLDHPVIKAMLVARKEQMAIVRAEGGMTDVLGIRHELRPAVKTGPERQKAVEPRHVLARVAQSRELNLLRPVIEDAIAESSKKRPNYRIVLWQHDGFTVSTKGSKVEDLRRIGRRLQRLVADRAEALGVPTALRVDVGPDLDG